MQDRFPAGQVLDCEHAYSSELLGALQTWIDEFNSWALLISFMSTISTRDLRVLATFHWFLIIIHAILPLEKRRMKEVSSGDIVQI